MKEEMELGKVAKTFTNTIYTQGLKENMKIRRRMKGIKEPNEPLYIKDCIMFKEHFQFSSVTQLCLILFNRMDCSTPGLPVHHQLQKFTQTHVHWIGDAIQPSHPLSSPSPPTFNLSQQQGLFKWVSSWHQVAKVLGVSASASVLPMNIQDCFPLEWTGWISLQFKWLSRVFFNITVQKHQFFGAQFSL